jgi:hypothetical protein
MIVSHTSHYSSSSNINEYFMKWIVLKTIFTKLASSRLSQLFVYAKVMFIYEIVEKTPQHHFEGNMTTAERN